MFKEGQTWLITMLDLVLLMVCFYVLNYSLSINTKVKQETSMAATLSMTKRAITATPLPIIYHNLLDSQYGEEDLVDYLKQEEIVRIISMHNFKNEILLQREAEKLSSYIYNFSKNQIKVQLLANYLQIDQDAIMKGEKVKQILKKLIAQASNFRNLLAKNLNNDNIVTIIDLHSNYPTLRNKKWLIVVDMFGEPN